MAHDLPSIDPLAEALRSTFGYDSFRPLQLDIIQSILRGEDVFVLMPTGGGKSLCYQLPALLRDGLTVVVSPLIALMKDQVDALGALGVPAVFINSSLGSAEIGRRQAAVARREVRILYVAPERLMAPSFLPLLGSVPIAFFAIDEAHCISEWGHDFRPEYRALARLRDLFPGTALGAFTATATARVQADIVDQLRLRAAQSYRGSFNRANLYYAVQLKDAPDHQLVAFLRGHQGSSGIVYCQSRAETERVAALLRSEGFSAEAYHAGLEAEARKQRQEAFIRDDTRIIVATIAFGMGIDKPDVRFVVHYDLPKSLEGYFQESGRAGRDGDRSDCVLLYGRADLVKQEYFIDQKPSMQEQAVARQQLRQMADWAESMFCRRRAILAYFDEPFDGQPAPCCDVCDCPPEMVDQTVAAQMLLSCVRRTGERFGVGYVVDVLRGSRAERILRLGHDRLSTFGIGKDRSQDEWRDLARQLLQAGYLQQEGEFRVVTVTGRGNAVLFRGERVLLPAPKRPRSRGSASVEATPNPALFEELRALRKRLADEGGLPPYVIFHDSALRQMAGLLPTSRVDLLHISGVGQQKADDYGTAFLEAIATFVRATGTQPVASMPPMAQARRTSRSALGSSARATLLLFNEGRSLVEIAEARQLALSTVEEHLAEAIEAGDLADLDRLVSPDRQRAIEAAIAELGPALMKPIRERLGEEYSYTEIRYVRASISARATPVTESTRAAEDPRRSS